VCHGIIPPIDSPSIDPSKRKYAVGGACDLDNPDLDYHCVPLPEQEIVKAGKEFVEQAAAPVVWSTLDYDRLAYQQLSIIAYRIDSHHQTWEMTQIPKGRGALTGTKMLQLFGEAFEVCTEANYGIPPFGCSQDFASQHQHIMMAFLGLLKPETLRTIRFFNKCTFQKISQDVIPYFIYSVMYYLEYPMFTVGCTKHLAKSQCAHLGSGCRSQEWGAVFASPACGVAGGP
jgi:hypothetical protein